MLVQCSFNLGYADELVIAQWTAICGLKPEPARGRLFDVE